jgi:hypothetical protein
MRRGVLALCALGLLAACDEESPTHERDASLADDAAAEDAGEPLPEPGSLINNALWQIAEPSADPFAREPLRPCPPLSAGDETLGGELVYAIRTERCPALTVRQNSRRAVLAGDTISVRAYHFPLTAAENASALVVLQLGVQEIFRRELPIPSDASELSDSWVADRDYPAGTPLMFHVENHGENEYALIAVDVSR